MKVKALVSSHVDISRGAIAALQTHEDLLVCLQLNGPALRNLIANKESLYKEHRIPRRSRSRPRRVHEATHGLRRVQRVIAIMLTEHEDALPDYVCGFRRGGSILRHAAPHCNKRLVAVADIQSYFASITEDRVTRLFVDLGAHENVAMTLARLTTLRGTLPEGARSSPAIANIVGNSIDVRIFGSGSNPWKYTRYADDLAFSGDQVPSEAQVSNWLTAEAFKLKPGSYKVCSGDKGPYVTGLFVGGREPRTPRKRRRLIERTLYYMEMGFQSRALSSMYNSSRWHQRSENSQMAYLASLIESVAVIEPIGVEWRNRLRRIVSD
jgi:RNA-directed DNA polymerase